MLRFSLPWVLTLVTIAGVVGGLLVPRVHLVYPDAARALKIGVICLLASAGISFLESLVGYQMGLLQFTGLLGTLGMVGFWGTVAWAVFMIGTAPDESKP